VLIELNGEARPSGRALYQAGGIEIDDVKEDVKEICDEKILVVVPVVFGTKVDGDFCARWNAGA